jgi:tight adherence protein C
MNALLDSPYGSWVFGIAVGLTIALLAIVLLRSSGILLDPMRRRLRSVEVAGPGGGPDLLERIGATIQALRETLRVKLIRAGWRDPGALAVMYTLKALLAAAVPAAIVFASASMQRVSLEGTTAILLLTAGAVIGWWLPNYLLSRRIKSRQRDLMEAFPDALDLLVACTEAGLGLNAAIERVAEQLPASSPDLAAELALVNSEIRAGVDRLDALHNLSTRTGLKEIRGLVSLINHSMRFGTGIASTLRIYADEFRDRRLQRAEEAAATVGTKLVFPLVICVFPSFFLVAIGPALIGVFKALADWPGL